MSINFSFSSSSRIFRIFPCAFRYKNPKIHRILFYIWHLKKRRSVFNFLTSSGTWRSSIFSSFRSFFLRRSIIFYYWLLLSPIKSLNFLKASFFYMFMNSLVFLYVSSLIRFSKKTGTIFSATSSTYYWYLPLNYMYLSWQSTLPFRASRMIFYIVTFFYSTFNLSISILLTARLMKSKYCRVSLS